MSRVEAGVAPAVVSTSLAYPHLPIDVNDWMPVAAAGIAPVDCGLGEVGGGVAEQVRIGPQPVATDLLAGALGGGGRGVKLTRTS